MTNLNLQLHAEGEPVEVENAGAEQAAENKPSYDELVRKLADAEALAVRNKNALDNASKQAADFKRQLREKQSEQERIEADKAEELAELESLRKQVKKMGLKDKLVGASMTSEMADKFADAILDSDPDGLVDYINDFAKSIKAAAMQEFLSERGNPKGGIGSNNAEDDAVKFAKAAASRLKNDGGNLEKFL